jgi:hypothetical protein
MIRNAVGVAILVLLVGVPAAQAATLTRGPYLQLGTESSIVVRWRTDTATDSRVRYGALPGSLGFVVDVAVSTTQHEVTLSGLAPDTVYYYAVGSTTQILAGDDADHFFLTAPSPGTAKPTRIWVLGDSGTADSNARAVRDAYYSFSGSRHTDLWLMLGDNAYSSGTDSEYQAAVFNMYPTMLRKSVLWPTLGNHDGGSADSGTQTGPYYDIFTLPKGGEAGGLASGTEAYYSFDYGNIHFIVLDSFDSSRSPTGAMMSWLAADAAATNRDWIVAYWHHPPYSKGSHDSDSSSGLREMRENALPILEAAGVDLVLAGHSHSYERSFLIDGHYGSSSTLQPSMVLDGGDGRPTGDGAYRKASSGLGPHEGAVYTVAGSSGKTGGGSLDHPVMVVSLDVLGSLVLDVQGNRLDATFLRSTGVVADTFTIEKGCGSVATLEVSPPSLSVEVEATAQLTAVPRDAAGGALTGCPVSWSSSAPAVATVSAGGLVTGAAEGPATVSATTQGVSGQSSITVVPSTNVAPTLDPVADLAATEGASAALSLSFSDPDAGDAHTATVDWGDGSPVVAASVDQANDTASASHIYADDGVYPVVVSVSDGRGGMDQGGASAIVGNVPPTASAGGPYSGVEGSPITFAGTASDPGADVLVFEWDFDYDGSTFQVEATGATAQHSYALDGGYTVALRVTDDHVATLATTSVTVSDRAPVVLYLSLGSSATLPGGLSVANEDILAFDGSAYSLYFDGSDVGLASFTIDAFDVISPTELLISFTSSGTVGGVAMDDSDLVKFTATSLGSNTAGSFSMYFDGSDVGLTRSDEDVDAFELLPDGRLLVSTTGSVSVAGVSSGADEDLLEFTPASLGATTTGSWKLYFDGSDVGLSSSSSEDLDGLAVDASGKIYLSTTGSFSVSGVAGADEDVFVFTPTMLGSTTQGTFGPGLFFDGSAFGLSGNDVFAIDLP